MLNLGFAHVAPQTILVAEKLLFAKRHKAARTNDAVIKADRVDAEIQLAATITALLDLFFFVLHDAMKELELKYFQPFFAGLLFPAVDISSWHHHARTGEWLQHNNVY